MFLPRGDVVNRFVMQYLASFLVASHRGKRSGFLAFTRVIFYVRRIRLYLYKYKIYGTISIYILKGLAFVYQLM